MKYLTVFSDASWHPESGAAGYAFFVRDDQTVIKKAFHLNWTVANSNDAEVYAMCHAILHAVNNLPHEPGDCVVAQTDCQHVIYTFETAPNEATGSILAVLKAAGLTLRFKHIKGHTGSDDRRSYVNRWCDIAGRREQRKARRELIPPAAS